MNEPHQAIASRLVKGGRFLTQGMNAAVYVGMRVPLVVVDAIDNGIWTLRRGAVVQVRQRFAVHQAGKHRKVSPGGHYIESIFFS
jgi:hypothetical protein